MPASVTSLRSAEHTPLLFTTNMGLEDVVVEEYRERAEAVELALHDADDAPLGLQSYALVEVGATHDTALDVARRMKSVHHVLAPLYAFSLSGDGEAALQAIYETVKTLDVDAMADAETFRATTVRRGDHDFTSVDVQKWAGGALDARYDAAVDLEDYDAEVRVDVHDDRCLVSVQHTKEALSRRQACLFQPRAALKPNVAYALLHLAHCEAPDVLLDPFCGSGTILWEAGALWPDTRLVGNDWDEETLDGARRNAEAQGLTDRVTLHEADVWYLAETLEGRQADLVVTNPPLGVRLASSMDFGPFYRRLLEQLDAVLTPEGRVVLLVLRQSPFKQALGEVGIFDIRHVRALEIGGLYPRVFVLGRA